MRGNSAEPTTLDPHKATTVWEDWIMGDMFVGLMHQDIKGDPAPQACESVTASDENVVIWSLQEGLGGLVAHALVGTYTLLSAEFPMFSEPESYQ